jgi:proteasome lid subunit RPN8/RPN11
MVKVLFPPAALKRLEDHLEAAYPDEGAGFLLGSINGEGFVVEDVLPLENSWSEGSQANRFQLAPADSMKAELTAAQRGLDVIGVFHSHPDHPAEPSQWDLAWASWPNFSYLITTVAEGTAARTRAWRLLEDRSAFTEDELEIIR